MAATDDFAVGNRVDEARRQEKSALPPACKWVRDFVPGEYADTTNTPGRCRPPTKTHPRDTPWVSFARTLPVAYFCLGPSPWPLRPSLVAGESNQRLIYSRYTLRPPYSRHLTTWIHWILSTWATGRRPVLAVVAARPMPRTRTSRAPVPSISGHNHVAPRAESRCIG